MRAGAPAALFVALVAATNARAERLTIAVSTPAVQISSNFAGVTVTTFGVIEGGEDQLLLDHGYSAVVVVIGPPRTVVERRKDRLVGIWANAAAETLVGAPTFYAIDSSAPLATVATPATMARLGLGFDNLAVSIAGGAATPPDPEFRNAFIRLQSQAALFTQGTGAQFIGDSIFRSNTFLPANIPEGTYTVLAYLFARQELVASAESSLTVSKTGFEQTVASFATGQSLIYGVLTVGLAIFVGWLGGVIFRRD